MRYAAKQRQHTELDIVESVEVSANCRLAKNRMTISTEADNSKHEQMAVAMQTIADTNRLQQTAVDSNRS